MYSKCIQNSEIYKTKILLKDVSENLNIPLNALESIDSSDITILNILDAYKEEYCKELWRDKQRKIESSSYVDGQLVAVFFFICIKNVQYGDVARIYRL